MNEDQKVTTSQTDSSSMPAVITSLTGKNPSQVEKKYKILIVDDEPDARELFLELLNTIPEYEVEGAEDGNKALEACEKTKFDLILLDIVMPNLDGVDTLAAIKAKPDKYGSPVVIMLTNIGGDIAIQEALKLGAIGYKLKIDTEPEELLATVKEGLENKSLSNSGESNTTPSPAKEAQAPVQI